MSNRAIVRLRPAIVIGIGFVFVFTVTLTFSGFQALLPVLEANGAFEWLCVANSTPAQQNNNTKPCIAQRARLEQLYTVSVTACNVALVPSGWILDQFGPRLYGTGGGVLTALGLVLFAFAQQLRSGMAYFVGYASLAVGNTLIVFTLFRLSSLVPHRTGTIVTAIRLCEPFSAGAFWLFAAAVRAGIMSLQEILLWYSVLPLAFSVYCLLLIPAGRFTASNTHGDGPDQIASTPGSASTDDDDLQSASTDELRSNIINSDVVGIPPNSSASNRSMNRPRRTRHHQEGTWAKIKDWLLVRGFLGEAFWLQTAWLGIILAGCMMFESTVRTRALSLLHAGYSDDSSFPSMLVDVFTLVFIFGGLLAAPIGFILDGPGLSWALFSTAVMFVIFSFLLAIPSSACLYAASAVYFVARGASFSVATHAALSEFEEYFGLMSGCVFGLAGMMQTMNALWISLMTRMEPENAWRGWTAITLAFALAVAIVSAFYIYRVRSTGANICKQFFAYCGRSDEWSLIE